MSPTPALTGLRKAAILLTLVEEDAAAEVYRHLSEEDLHALTLELSEVDQVVPEISLQVLEEYAKLTSTQDCFSQGGAAYARKLLIRAFGEEQARQKLAQVSRTAELSTAKLESLQKTDPLQLAKFLEPEHPQTIALILAHLNAKQASELLMRLPKTLRGEAVKRLAQLRQFSPEMAQRVSVVLHKRLESLGEQSRRTYAGSRGVADLLNRLEPNSSRNILEAIEKEDAKLALSIRNLMFTFEDFLSVPEAGIRELLSQVDKKTLALALRGASEELKLYIFKSMSSRAVEMLKEDMEVLGAVKSRDVVKAQQELVSVARRLESEGKLTLTTESEDEYVV
jgi:flagellar motor switch protein FliG